MSTLVSYTGIITALDNLEIKPGTQKADFIRAIKARLPNQEALATTTAIAAEGLIQDIWNTNAPEAIKKRRKSLSSIKSSINKSLKRLSQEGKNPEWIIISRDNTFMVSEERKNDLLEKLGSSMSGSDINNLTEMIARVKNNLQDQQQGQTLSDLIRLMDSLDDASRTIRSLQEQLETKDELISDLSTKLRQTGIAGEHGGSEGEDAGELEGDDLEVIEDEDAGELEGDDLEVIEDEDAGELEGDDLEVIEDEDAGELEADDLEVIEGEDAGELEGDDLEVIEDEDAGEVEEDDGDKSQNKLLEVLSKYMEPEEAVDNSREALIESEEGLVAQLLARFTPKFIKIPGGTYPIGSKQKSDDEHPLVMQEVQPFYLGQYPITNDLFELFVRETGYKTEAETRGFGIVHRGRCVAKTDPKTGRASFSISRTSTHTQQEGADWRHPDGPESSVAARGDHPVVQVSRHDAKAFAVWAGKRLPNEEEWEAAARGFEYLIFPWGHKWRKDCGNFGSSYLGTTAPVHNSRNGISPLGIVDLLGNVYEWTSQLDQAGPSGRKRYILKGGAWNSKQVTISHRQISENTWSNIIGFRCAV